jgi:outer membrane protein OmpA-like peptidoglycan-associated protein
MPKEDTDQDGLEDAEDGCVNTPGPKENNGCPVLSDADQELIRKTAAEILFLEPGVELKPSSYSSLEELARWLVAQPAALLMITAHTDSEGAQNDKMTLSKERAESVRQFLISKNINPLRVTTAYFGGAKPIADNNSAEGRLRNNRVELTVKFK